ncbi:MAG: hypothetical protein CVU78_01055 [Elusimicrobia bacterium HGW-Elusimicrobia-2]|nr:MAG: hypothetical protein CVU78_01055 [Elusimicrobia bacterium HGW-Elusimicrobia-2]
MKFDDNYNRKQSHQALSVDGRSRMRLILLRRTSQGSAAKFARSLGKAPRSYGPSATADLQLRIAPDALIGL